ncbi:MAG: hypothetical protein IH899_22210 [Planctomycetes bacterium]|nr:hypothetical protein [Planctomycetota bacterium]
MRISGIEIDKASAEQWSGLNWLSNGPEFNQEEKLRRAIVEKNLLYFYSWRPQNVTYLFLFRKHEQGQNAKEVEEFRKLVAEKEKEIARLKKPVTHTYELIRVKDTKKQ